MFWIGFVVAVVLLLFGLHWLSYGVLKKRIVAERSWDLNICCGGTDGGGVNADIVQHSELPNFVEIEDIYDLPFADQQFEHVLCSHTIEHVDDPERFFAELQRVGQQVTLILPPLWDVGAALDIFEHKWVFLVLGKRYTKLPPRLPLPFARWWHKVVGQTVKA